MITDEQVIADRLDLEMLERPHLWPGRMRGFPCVQLKRGTGNQTAQCIKDEGAWVLRIYDWTEPNAIENATIAVFDTAEAVRADGWRVD